jgi:threonyl-tRNA synthetase
MLVIGDNEVESDGVSVRERTQGDIGAMSVDDFIRLVLAKD